MGNLPVHRPEPEPAVNRTVLGAGPERRRTARAHAAADMPPMKSPS
jgi:hypothetical protein